MGKAPLSKLGIRVFARLKDKGMTLGELEQRMEEETGMFLKLGYLDKHLRRNQRLHHCVYVAIKDFLGEPVRYRKGG